MPDGSSAEACGLLVIKPHRGDADRADFTVREISEAGYERYLSAANRLHESLKGNLIVYMRQALANLTSTVDQIDKIIRRTPVYTIQASVDGWQAAIGCCVLTVCSALHLHQEQSLAEAIRHHGKNSQGHVRVRTAFSAAYDDQFCYRLLYQLRNVLVHHSLGSVGLNLSGRERTKSGLIAHQFEVRVPLHRQEFLRSGKVKKVLRDDLTAMLEDPDLLYLCQQVMPVLEEVNKKITAILNPTLYEDARKLAELDALFGPADGLRALTRVRYSPADDPRPDASTSSETRTACLLQDIANREPALRLTIFDDAAQPTTGRTDLSPWPPAVTTESGPNLSFACLPSPVRVALASALLACLSP